MNYYDTIKSLHIIFVVSWFAGLFYIIRLFIYHTEAQEKTPEEARILSDQFIIMERKLWWIITSPAMYLTVLFGVWMLIIVPPHLSTSWMKLKLIFVFLLIIYHFICQQILFKLKAGKFKCSSNQLRLWNELATLFLVIIVFLVELKDSMDWIKGTLGFVAVGLLLMISVKIYKIVIQKKAKIVNP